MGPKKVSGDISTSRKYARNTIEMKKEIIAKYESGIKITEIGRMYGKAPSTISSILAKKEAIKEANVAKGVDRLTKQRSQAMEEVEKLLLIWINQKQLNGDPVSEAMICEKAKLLYADLIQKMPGTSDNEVSDFKASRGWFQNFKRRAGIHSVSRHGEAASSDKYEDEKFESEYQDYLEAEGFFPQQVFNCDETGLFQKKMPKRTFITQEQTALPGHTPKKDRLTLLVCGNANVEELVEDHGEELTTQDIHIKIEQTADEEAALEKEEETRENVPSSEIKDILSMWSKVQGFVEKHHPDKAVVGCVCNSFNDNVLPHFRQIIKRRQKQISMDSFLVRHRATDSEAGPSAKITNFHSKE